MKNKPIINAGNFTYPGEYVPLCSENELQQMLSLSRECDTVAHPAGITELADGYQIEIALPGIERENILLLAHGNTIAVLITKKTSSDTDGEIFQHHEPGCDCFSCYINVAADADLEFASAVCHSGMLRIYVPKSATSTGNTGTFKMVVY